MAGRRQGGASRPHLAAARPPVAPGAFSILPESSRDVSHGEYVFMCYFALESLFLAFLKFTLEYIEYTKLMEIVSANPILVDIHTWWRTKCSQILYVNRGQHYYS